MEPRRVVLVVEAVTDLPVKQLRRIGALAAYIEDPDGVVACHPLLAHQIQVNVVEGKAKGKTQPKRRSR